MRAHVRKYFLIYSIDNTKYCGYDNINQILCVDVIVMQIDRINKLVPVQPEELT